MLEEVTKKFKGQKREIRDIDKEHELEKQELLDTIRLMEKEQIMYYGICQMILTDDEIEIIKGASEWNEDNKKFKIPPFYFKDRKVVFPKLNIGGMQ